MMKILLNELKKFVNLDGVSNETLFKSLNSLAYEVEYFHKINNLKNKSLIKLAKVLNCKKHPNADRLSVCNILTEDKEYQVVCGAKNIQEGQTVAHALPGSIVNNLKLQQRKIRGILSNGMILSLQEILDLKKEIVETEEKENIFVFDNRISLKNNFFDLLKINDYLIDITILPDRNYANSYQFLAREIAAYLNLKFVDDDKDLLLNFNPEINLKTKSEDLILTEDAVAFAISNVLLNNKGKNKTPFEIKLVLYLNDIKPQNNILDLIFYFKLIYGLSIYPIKEKDKYFFDGELINDKINIFESDPFKDFDQFSEKFNLIAFASKKKKNITIEKNINHFFGKQNAKGTEFSQVSLLELFLIYAKKYDYLKSYSNILVKNLQMNDYSNQIKTISLSEDYLKNYVGEKINLININEKLKILGFDYIQDKQIWKIPNYRFDINAKQDLIEEIIRYYGIENIAGQKYPIVKEFVKIENNKYFIEKVTNLLIGYGFNEVKNTSFINQKEFDKYNLWDIKNPILLSKRYSIANNILRNSLLKGLLNNHNLNYKNDFEDIRLFEFGNIYFSTQENDFKLAFGLIFDDKIKYELKTEDKNQQKSPLLIGDKIIKEVFKIIGLKTDYKYLVYKELTTKTDIFNQNQAVEVYYNGDLVAYFGELNHSILRANKYIRLDKIKAQLYYLEMI
ncbi:MAG: phenylalanine--tRNA ligase beta subunit [Candidatus Hepatoplasma scabrum]|nr:MAG: phenylalanine--tRNA ligase beta subunit [Candidatus Hepatoplasma sp.]